MQIDFLIFYYAMGWLSCGISFAIMPQGLRCPPPLMLSAWFFLLPFTVFSVCILKFGGIEAKPQYLWRRP